ncbi:AI-2E family transporter [Solitalea koreensis]|uniref:AI-2E family transporter n=1 Tax=Solitalea koreensis TaxID=543615 RepID=UPI001C8F29A4|nr:AI-2E family transporter [Solitalea koreensis]
MQIILLSGFILYWGKDLFVPLCFGFLIAMILYPACKWLEEKKCPRSLAITLLLSILSLLSVLLIWILILEIQTFQKDLPELIKKIELLTTDLQRWLTVYWNIPIDKQSNWFENVFSSITKDAGSLLGGTISITIKMLFLMFITPVFTVLFLFNRGTFVKVLELMVGESLHKKLHEVLDKIIKTYFNYIKGMIAVYLIVGVLNSFGLLLLGIEHAILFGMLTAVMTIVPYVGIIISALLPISVAWLSSDSIWLPIGVIAVFGFVQYLEANLIFPMVVGAQLNINTWASIIAIIIGGILWGVSGMVLSLPFLAILKLASDNLEELKPLNILISR